ncbi:MAG: alcohol dehydrogenase catalytic domain-containing protein [Chitinivibrionales bacterium]|nr:alcohol dehydrogenase catalytic domain-containing protein [Chitinivibrionales bacterium]
MKAAVINAPQDFVVTDVPTPGCPEDGLLVQVLACGLCGSDLRTLRSGHHRVTLPFVVGHEIAGTVAEVGPRCAGQWQAGDVLSIAPLVYCGTCPFCVEGRFELCDGYREIAQAWPGGFAEYIAIPAEAVARGTIRAVPQGLDPAIAAVAEPVSSCVHAQEKGAVGLGDTVAVLGAGPIGCIHTMLAHARGASTVIVADVNATRLALTQRFGPDHLIDASREELVEAVRHITNGRGADCVITANPAPQSQIQALEMARKGGRILLFGGLPPEKARPGLNTNLIHYNALNVIGTTIFAPRHHAIALDLLRSGRIDGDALVTHRFPLTDFVKGANLALAGEVIKAVFMP